MVLVLLGCSSAVTTPAPLASNQLPPAMPSEDRTIDVVGVEVTEVAGETTLLVKGGAPLTWTSYRNADDMLVIELPGAASDLDPSGLDLSRGVVKSVEVEQSTEPRMTRLLIATTVDAAHSVTAEGSDLVVGFEPIESWSPEVVATVATINNDPLPAAFTSEESEGEVAEEPSLGPAPTGVPATQLHGVDVATGDGSTVIGISGDGSFYYSTFSLENPNRFVVDLIGVVNTSPVSTITVQGPLVDGVRVAQYKPQPELVSRVVVDLVKMAMPEVEATSDGLRLTFFEDQAYEPAADVARAVEADLEQPEAEEVEVAASEIAPDVPPAREEEVTAAAIAEEVAVEVEEPVYEEPVMAAVEVEEPVYEEPVYEEPVMAAVEVEEPVYEEPVMAAVEVEEPVYEEPVMTAAEVEPVPAEDVADAWPSPPAQEPAVPGYEEKQLPSEASLLDFAATDLGMGEDVAFGAREVGEAEEERYRGEPMTMTLRDADIKDVLRSFAQISGLNVVVQPEVSGTVTVELTNVPWDQALDQILKINGLGYQLEGNIMRVAPLETLRAEEESKARLAEAKARSIPLKTIMRRVSYAGADEIASILRSGGGASIMSVRGSVVVDKRTNTLIIKELPSHINTVIAVIENLDIPEPQVMIEARIIETTKRFSRTLGVQWGFSGIADPRYGNTTGLQFPNRGTIDGGVELLTGGSNGFLDITLGNVLNSFNLDMALQAAENEGLINILSAPKITTLNNERATIQSGLQIPIQTIANNTVSVQFVNATLRLEVTPHVTAEGTVLMDIDIQKREPQLAFAVVGAANAPIATKDASTRVIVRDGGTTVIGGIYKVTSDQGEDRVPGLSNVPILKHLFKNKRRNDENEELLIFITPRVIRL